MFCHRKVLAAGGSGDLACTVALKHTTGSVNSAPPQPYMLWVTTVVRHEDGGERSSVGTVTR
jgi:hypothetical protein